MWFTSGGIGTEGGGGGGRGASLFLGRGVAGVRAGTASKGGDSGRQVFRSCRTGTWPVSHSDHRFPVPSSRKGVWRWGKREIIYLSLHCHHHNDSCIKMGSDESHFNVS